MSLERDAVLMEKKLLDLAAKFPQRVARGLYLECNNILSVSKILVPVSPTAAQLKAMGRYAPKNVIPGQLRASGRVEEPEITLRTITCKISYGNEHVLYATIQHERTDFFHTNGQAKYLEQPLNAARPVLGSRIAKHIHFDNGDTEW